MRLLGSGVDPFEHVVPQVVLSAGRVVRVVVNGREPYDIVQAAGRGVGSLLSANPGPCRLWQKSAMN